MKAGGVRSARCRLLDARYVCKTQLVRNRERWEDRQNRILIRTTARTEAQRRHSLIRTVSGKVRRFLGSFGAGEPGVGASATVGLDHEGRTERTSEMRNMCRLRGLGGLG